MKRNAVVVGHMVTFLSSLLLDWQLGTIEANMPKRGKRLRIIAEELGPAYIKVRATSSICWGCSAASSSLGARQLPLSGGRCCCCCDQGTNWR